MQVYCTRHYGTAVAIGDYAAKRDMYRGAASRARKNGRKSVQREHLDRALYYRAVVRAIRQQFPGLTSEAGFYFGTK